MHAATGPWSPRRCEQLARSTQSTARSSRQTVLFTVHASSCGAHSSRVTQAQKSSQNLGGSWQEQLLAAEDDWCHVHDLQGWERAACLGRAAASHGGKARTRMARLAAGQLLAGASHTRQDGEFAHWRGVDGPCEQTSFAYQESGARTDSCGSHTPHPSTHLLWKVPGHWRK